MPDDDTERVSLSYRRAIGRKRPIVLIHGWCCDSTYMGPLFSHFVRHGHTVMAMDLRGHGRSDKPDLPYTMQIFADDIALLCAEVRLLEPVFVGHSMGGIVAFEMAVRYPHLASAVVMLDAAVALPESTKAAIPNLIEELRGPDYRAALRSYVSKVLFMPSDDAERKASILDQMTSTPQHVIVSCLEGLAEYDPSPAGEDFVMPSLYIAADEPVPRADMSRLQKLVPRMLTGKTVGSGHFCQLEVPDQITAMIERFLTVTFPSG
ncbi:alpha/beta hydrolase [Methyloligella sp. 2.7D]|uniref:alpha/beta fold hydrolase n=1 Tax=unclassified Methyloligella TaxID=2625955 RepID=UPI00157BE864|nr:alpha/beta hydrolase [Methyloligella sp. GL2]QKP76710.1 alpha/beta hydrolase [Methyloligella sp. GL2]